MAKRVLAAVGAVALVLAALAVRGALDDDGPDPGPGRSDSDDVVLVCDPDLADHCRAVEGVTVRVEDSAVTSAALVAGEVEGSAWVTSSAWVEVTDGRLASGTGGIGEIRHLASAEVAVAAVPARASILTDRCAGRPVWRCLGDDAGRPWSEVGGLAAWGVVRTGLPDADTALGLPVLASVAVGYFDGTTFAANDFQELASWLARLAEPSDGGDRNLLRTLVRVRGTYDAGGVVRQEAEQRTEVEVLPTEPTVAAHAVVVELDGSIPADALDAIRSSLVETGWEGGGDEAPGALLGRGVMGALHALWKDVT